MKLLALVPALRFAGKIAAGQSPQLLSGDGREIGSLSELVEHLAAQHGVSARTYWRWFTEYVDCGFGRLVVQPRRDKGARKVFRSRDAVLFVLGLWLTGWDAPPIYRALLQAWPRLCRDRSSAPSYGSLLNLLKSMTPPTSRKKANKRPRPQLAVVTRKQGDA